MMQGSGGPGGPGMQGGQGGGSGGPGGGDTNAKPDFTDPLKGAVTFLNAVNSRDATRIAEATAKRAKTEASTQKNKDLFAAILDGGVDSDQIEKLSDGLKGFQARMVQPSTSTASCKVVVSKEETDEKTKKRYNLVRLLTMRKEKSEWKVSDVGSAKKYLNQ